MGHVSHNVVIITSWSDPDIRAAHQQAVYLGCRVTDITKSAINGYETFLLVPDGSKSGWPEDEKGDAQRKELLDWLESQRHEDGSSSLEWVEIEYGNDDHDARVVRHAWSDRE